VARTAPVKLGLHLTPSHKPGEISVLLQAPPLPSPASPSPPVFLLLSGLDAPTASPADVAKYTTRTMMRSIPPAVPGIHFLSGGMSEEESTLNLQALQEACPNAPWSLTFSYGRALQSTTLKVRGQEGKAPMGAGTGGRGQGRGRLQGRRVPG
jgi:fructose-bisphosphate aldolase class I